MSEKSSLSGNSTRTLRQEEVDLLRAILEGNELGTTLSTKVRVRDLSDGGMGSIEFLSGPRVERRQAKCIAEADYMDSNGVPVSISVNIDQHGRLFELDIWKVDFGQLRTYPSARTIRNVRRLG
jgi:Domain of unknown function (DUF6984)